MSTNTARISALESSVADINGKLDALLAAFNPQAPAVEVVVEAQPKADSEFVTWLRDSAEARKARKASNADLAAFLRGIDVNPSGEAWALAKDGVTDKRKLRAAGKRDLKAAQARKAAKKA